ncbi:Nucleolar protein 56 [Galdieria sulphuraria]|uniref:Nucleolar protein 56 n=1 Tax=Galdieria sulphuraria TaxID=130081 RepID=M2Y314_GALSU|nr:box C/D snoRNP component Nop56 [Galdieria sulphuraria]EME30328.1 box C/D snoRNP component Nop56 [Galdieria sulphuraria]GJD13010.1 Nucleolar protein 56 [Galdieria sulphuraria]|eukprot:XP_005706848.1 box C/D snoRNP component Nop56 [Galdieria sulphuraria]
MPKSLYILYESAAGFSLFYVENFESIASNTEEFQDALSEFVRFSKLAKLIAFSPFTTAETAFDNLSKLSEYEITANLSNFLDSNLPKVKEGKKPKYELGVFDHKLAAVIHEQLKLPATSSEKITEIIRNIRLHFERFVDHLRTSDVIKAQLGLAHAYSRSKVKYNVNRADTMVVQSITLLDQLDKDINTFAMRVKEWYSWHFPELVKIVSDNIVYARCVQLIGDKSTLSEDSLTDLEKLVGDEQVSKNILDAARTSMGTGIEEVDLINIRSFAARVVKLAEYRKHLHDYLIRRMNTIAPNLSALLGEQVSARLIAHAGSLTNLAKYPASTVQILGAEKALFRALKTKGKTPKYGLLFHSSFIGKAKQKNKGRISRYLANKCSIASRIDCFSDVTSDIFGRTLREQVEERLKFYETGSSSQKNTDVMRKAMDELNTIVKESHEDLERAVDETDVEKEENMEEDNEERDRSHKSKKDKSKKKDKEKKKKHKRKKEKMDTDESNSKEKRHHKKKKTDKTLKEKEKQDKMQI